MLVAFRYGAPIATPREAALGEQASDVLEGLGRAAIQAKISHRECHLSFDLYPAARHVHLLRWNGEASVQIYPGFC